jgi:riboflavin kinase/FMN adenylyltransferase
MLRQLAEKAKELNLPSTVVIFEPQPQEFLTHYHTPARLTRLREKLLAMERYGVERVFCLRFDESIAALSASDFIKKILVEDLAIKCLVIGDDFHFGKGRQGNFHLLQQAGKQYGFNVENQNTFIFDNQRVSSTRVREALMAGNMSLAKTLLGRPYTLCGRVGYGQQKGRDLGFPTANIYLHREFSPITGVFAVFMHGVSDTPLPGVANLGIRPTVGTHQLLLEVHLFNFNQLIYGRYVEVEFVCKLRDEQKFSSFDALKTQIHHDVQATKRVLNIDDSNQD